MQDNSDETDLIRRLLLWQVPTTDEEATVLAFHLWGLFDQHTELDRDERKALEIGRTNLFDYLVSEGRADMEKMGQQFATGAMLAWNRRRYRTGLFPED